MRHSVIALPPGPPRPKIQILYISYSYEYMYSQKCSLAVRPARLAQISELTRPTPLTFVAANLREHYFLECRHLQSRRVTRHRGIDHQNQRYPTDCYKRHDPLAHYIHSYNTTLL